MVADLWGKAYRNGGEDDEEESALRQAYSSAQHGHHPDSGSGSDGDSSDDDEEAAARKSLHAAAAATPAKDTWKDMGSPLTPPGQRRPPPPPPSSSWLREAWRAAVHSLFSPRALIFFMIAMNSSILAPNLTIIAHEFEFSDEERDSLLGGRLPLVFFAAGIPSAVITGCLSDLLRDHRRILVHLTSLLAFLATFSVSRLPPDQGPDGFTPLLWLRGICGAASGAAITAGEHPNETKKSAPSSSPMLSPQFDLPYHQRPDHRHPITLMPASSHHHYHRRHH